MKLSTKLLLTAASVLTSLSMFTTQANEIYGATSKDLIPIQRQYAAVAPRYPAVLKPGVEALKVTAWVDHENLVYKLGDTVKFYVKANKDCYITLLDIGTTGKTHIIFPNKFQRTNSVKAGQVVSLPRAIDNYDFKATGARGKEVVKVIATMERETIIPERYLQKAGHFMQIRTKDISVVPTYIMGLLDTPNKSKEWAEYTKVLTIR